MNKLTSKQIAWLVGGGIAALFLLIFSFFAFDIHTVKGNEIGVMESWSGVDDEPRSPGTYFLFPGWSRRVYNYDMGVQVFVMNDNKGGDTKYAGRDADAYHVQSAEGQDMAISLVVQWRIDPMKIVQIHKMARNNIEDIVLRPVVMRLVKDEATVCKAIDAYSGEGLVKLQAAIQKDLCDPQGELAERGIIVEQFVIEGIKLDDKFIGEIRARQVATQRRNRAEEETKAAEAEALKAKAEAQADYNKRVVEAERDAKVAILKAQQEAESSVVAAKASAEKVELAAKADKKVQVLAAEAEKEAGVLKAQAIKALGEAKADATKLELTAYSVAGSENYVKMKVAESMAKGFEGIKGYLPSDMRVNILSESFMRSVEGLLGAPPVPKK